MRTALISLIETVPGSTALRGALPLAHGRLAMLHIDLAVQAGAGEILCLVASARSRVMPLSEDWRFTWYDRLPISACGLPARTNCW